MKKIWKTCLLLVILILALGACGGAAQESVSVAYEDRAEPGAAADAAGETSAPTAANVQNTNVAAEGELPAQPMIIRTGSLSIVVPDTDVALADISALANRIGGWIVNSNVRKYGQANRGDITVRVPVAQFDATMRQIKEMAQEVTSESSSGEDVTEEYVDLTARLTNLEATADRVRNFLDEAKDVEDALAVNRELSNLESQIEQLKGRIKYLTQSAAFSTIQVEITPDALSQPLEIAGWRPQGVAKEALEDLVNFLQGFIDFLIRFVIYVLPQLLILGVPAFFIIRAIVRAIRKRRQPAATPPESQ